MAVTVPYVRQTWTDGVSSASAARMTVMEDGLENAHKQPCVRVYHNATQSLTSGVETALAFNTELYDTAGGAASTMHDNATNNSRLTAIYAGKYHVSANVCFAVNATGQRWIAFRINGTANQYMWLARIPGHASVLPTLHISGDVDLAVNDYVQLIALQDSGGALNVNAGTALAPYNCEFAMHRVG